jgi:hypothetical protein
MLAFAKAVSVSLLIGVAVALWRAKPGARLKEALGVAGAILAISLACGLAVLLGVPIHGLLD